MSRKNGEQDSVEGLVEKFAQFNLSGLIVHNENPLTLKLIRELYQLIESARKPLKSKPFVITEEYCHD